MDTKEKLLDRLTSTRFWLAVMGAILPVILQGTSGAVTWPVAIGSMTTVVVGYIFGESYRSAQQAHADARVTAASATMANFPPIVEAQR